MTTKSNKAKGRRLQNWVRDNLLLRMKPEEFNEVVEYFLAEVFKI